MFCVIMNDAYLHAISSVLLSQRERSGLGAANIKMETGKQALSRRGGRLTAMHASTHSGVNRHHEVRIAAFLLCHPRHDGGPFEQTPSGDWQHKSLKTMQTPPLQAARMVHLNGCGQGLKPHTTHPLKTIDRKHTR